MLARKLFSCCLLCLFLASCSQQYAVLSYKWIPGTHNLIASIDDGSYAYVQSDTILSTRRAARHRYPVVILDSEKHIIKTLVTVRHGTSSELYFLFSPKVLVEQKSNRTAVTSFESLQPIHQLLYRYLISATGSYIVSYDTLFVNKNRKVYVSEFSADSMGFCDRMTIDSAILGGAQALDGGRFAIWGAHVVAKTVTYFVSVYDSSFKQIAAFKPLDLASCITNGESKDEVYGVWIDSLFKLNLNTGAIQSVKGIPSVWKVKSLQGRQLIVCLVMHKYSHNEEEQIRSQDRELKEKGIIAAMRAPIYDLIALNPKTKSIRLLAARVNHFDVSSDEKMIAYGDENGKLHIESLPVP